MTKIKSTEIDVTPEKLTKRKCIPQAPRKSIKPSFYDQLVPNHRRMYNCDIQLKSNETLERTETSPVEWNLGDDGFLMGRKGFNMTRHVRSRSPTLGNINECFSPRTDIVVDTIPFLRKTKGDIDKDALDKEVINVALKSEEKKSYLMEVAMKLKEDRLRKHFTTYKGKKLGGRLKEEDARKLQQSLVDLERLKNREEDNDKKRKGEDKLINKSKKYKKM